MRSPQGDFTNGVFTMMRGLENILNNQSPSHMCICWDISRDTFRRELYPAYKGTRSKTPDELKSQFALTQRVLNAMNIQQMKLRNYEADDLLGAIAKRYEQEISTVIFTKDQDALQLVSENTRLWLVTDKAKDMYEDIKLNPMHFNLPNNTVELSEVLVKHFYGVYPSQIPDMKGLDGDTSDNIPGVKGVGPKSIIPLLNEFGTIENLYDYLENTSENEAKSFIKSIGISRSPYNSLMKMSETEIVGKISALLSKQLATIKTDIPELILPELDTFKVNVSESGRRNIYQELNFGSLLNQNKYGS